MFHIYRVEDSKKDGPYNCYCDELSKMYAEHSDSDAHPTPFREDEPFYYKNDPFYPLREYKFGFLTLESLLNWFKGFYEILNKNDFHIAVYQCPSREYILLGTSQIAFLANKCIHVKTELLPEERE